MTQSVVSYSTVTTTFPFAICILSFVALSPSPSAVSLVFLLAALQLYGRMMVQRQESLRGGAMSWLACTTGIALSHFLPSVHALSTPATSVVLLGVIAGITSALSMVIIYLDLKFAYSRTSWLTLVSFPALWATVWGFASLLSPVGRLVTWSPVTGTAPYSWTSQFVGPWGIDLLVGAWSVILVEATRKSLITAESPTTGPLIAIESTEEQYIDEPLPSSNLCYVLSLGALLVALMLPSYATPILPFPTFTAETTPLTVGCALPRTRLSDGRFSPATMNDYISESKKMSGAKIIIWPEGAITFETPAARIAGFKQLADFLQFQQSVYVGISFEEIDSSPGESRTTLKRNGFALVNHKDGIVLEYYKRHLVPIAESYSIAPSTSPPLIHTIHLKHPSNTSPTEWAPGENHTRPISVTSSICLDFASPSSFTSLESRPSLILAPARTWHESVGFAMWNQAKQRAHETGSMVLWCDGGEGGLSGVIGDGYGEPVQAGEGSWTKTIGLRYPFDERRTVFVSIGEFGAILVILIVYGGGAIFEVLLRHGRIRSSESAILYGRVRELPNWAIKGINEFWERRRVAAASAEAERGEQQSLL